MQEERARFTVTDEVLNAAIAAKSPREVLQVLTSMSAKPQLANTDINRILDYVRNLITTPATSTPANVEKVAEAEKPVATKKAKKAA
jgi:uncharacterized protein YciW